MMVFWILAAGLAGLALLFIVPPILSKKANTAQMDENQINMAVFQQQIGELDTDLASGSLDQSQYDSARLDLEKELLSDIDEPAPDSDKQGLNSGRWAAGVLAVAAPAVALAMYLMVGNHTAIDRPSPKVAAAQAREEARDLPPMDVLVQKLAERMEQNPEDIEGWVMLGRSYNSLGRHQEAIDAFERANALAPQEPVVLLGYAEALAKAKGSMEGKPAELITAALELEPSNANGLWMMGLIEFKRGNNAQAVDVWTRLLAQLDPNSEDTAALRGYIAEARQQGGMPEAQPIAAQTAAPQPAQQQAEPPAALTDMVIRVKVALADALKEKMDPNATLYVFARALQGPPMPLAVQRMKAGELPVELSLDDSMAMMEQMRLSNFPQVRVGARISKSDTAMPQSGDLEGEVKPVTPGQEEIVSVLIDSVRP